MKDPEASSSAAGYGYQYQRALYRIFSAPHSDTRFGIETADDVEEISQTGAGTRRISEQAKLVVRSRRNPLQDSSSNLWKTLRIWLEGLKAARLIHDELEFVIVTNKVVKEDSLVKLLSAAESDSEAEHAIVALRAQADVMTGKTGIIASEVVAFSDPDLAFVIKRMHIADGETSTQLKERTLVALHLPEDVVASREAIYEGLLGFLFGLCQDQWTSQKPFWTSAQPFFNKRQSLVDVFRDEPWEPLPLEETGFQGWMEKTHPDDMLFVAQLGKLDMPEDMLLDQIGYFWGAYSERVRLLDNGRVQLSDFDNAEKILKDRWTSIGSAHRMISKKRLEHFDVLDYTHILTETLFPKTFPVQVGRMKSTAAYLFSGIYHRMVNGEETKHPMHWHRDPKSDDQ